MLKRNNVNIGDIYGDKEIIEIIGLDRNYNLIVKTRCIKCGCEKITQFSHLKNNSIGLNHDNKYCKNYLSEYDENIGLVFNDVTIIRLDKITKDGYRYITKCNICGHENSNLLSNIKKGYSTKHKNCRKSIKDDGYLKRFKKIYSCMRYRTTNPNYTEYHLYGGRGISSEYFKDFMVFYKEMYQDYLEHVKKYGEKNTTLDRINYNGDYTKENCRWATIKEQTNNTRANKKFKIDNEEKTLSEWCDKYGLKYSTVHNRVKNLGWSIEKALELDDEL